MAFLSVYTPTYKRPFLLELCKASVAHQSVPVEHVIVEDTVGLGVDGMYRDLRNHAHKVTGKYVMVLSDDNILSDANFAADLERVTWENDGPPVVVFQGQCGPTLQPAHWGEPVETKIDLSNFAVEREVWQSHSHCWGERYAGDFDFIRALWDEDFEFMWWPRLAYQTLKISQGQPE